MKTSEWRVAGTSVIGTSHVKIQGICQDANELRLITNSVGETTLIAVASDGAGSAQRSDQGSRIACTTLLSQIEAFLETPLSVQAVTREAAQVWVDNVRSKLATMAADEGFELRDYACTLVGAIVGEDGAIFLQVGDGAIVVLTEENEYSWIFWPERGDYENTTFFLTQVDALNHLRFEQRAHRFDEVAVFTDGIQGLALHYQTQVAHTPFFRSLFAELRRQPAGYSSSLSESLTTFLNSTKVNERTDDDKTIVIASRVMIPTS